MMGALSDTDKLRAFLQSLPGDDTSRAFELMITEKVDQNEKKSGIKDLEAALLDIIEADEPVSYAAFYMLVVHYRHKKKTMRNTELLHEYKNRFGNRPSYPHLACIHLIHSNEYTRELFGEVIRSAYQRKQTYHANAGYVHQFACAALVAMQKSVGEQKTQLIETWYEKAREALFLAIDLDPSYARYHLTLSGLYLVIHQYEDALDSIDRAIALEDTEKENYFIKVNDYYAHRTTVMIAQKEAELRALTWEIQKGFRAGQNDLEASTERSIRKLNDNQIKNVEFLGFFAGVISLTIGGIQIAVQQPLLDAARLMIVLMGALLCVFSGFCFVISAQDNPKYVRHILMFAVGILFVVAGILLAMAPGAAQ